MRSSFELSAELAPVDQKLIAAGLGGEFGLVPGPVLSGQAVLEVGVTTAVGGGLLRDLLAGQTPMILRWDKEIYAVPALAGSAVTAVLLHLGQYTAWAGTLAALGAVALRLLALGHHWTAPRARRSTPAEGGPSA
ncbi:trimeric intracellular cation channel family protein [Streptomyces lancefieldiae]|uniref:TRIC cation channel family protein n=1 Tax=Streptomyces lancefieldiae TaxID=3075520 RepID=A0ABU3ATQ5_9ACTN|nr:TRIC cation channel family protein [Streptomyces sp. DSM 40712]MDT0612211.1 TRIC cation channel family protein [Streptomyces sp. DSM 40712]